MLGKGPVLLLVEDNATLRTTLHRYLDRRLPVTLVEASTAAEAVTLARRYQPAVVLLDLSLPDQPGVEAIQALHTVAPHAQVIAMATHLERQHGEAAKLAGAWSCVAKESLGTQLEPLIWRALPTSELTLTRRWARLHALVQSGPVGSIQRLAANGWSSAALGIRWLDLNGPWAGKPRTRLLYLANVVEIVLVFAIKQHTIGI